MVIISHRGYWKDPKEKNLLAAFQRSFSLGYGTETDIRDFAGKILVSHDLPSGNEMTLDALLRMVTNYRQTVPFTIALNVKSDGMAITVRNQLEKFGEKIDAFVFDMAVPDLREYLNQGFKVFTRLSEVEPSPAYLEKCEGVWIDAFDSIWYDASTLRELLAQGKRLALVSPELHNRDPFELWPMLKSFHKSENLILCTDLPEQADNYFKGYVSNG